MSTPSPPYQHRYATRSSPSLPEESAQNVHPSLFFMRADIHVKDTVCGRDSNSKRLPQQVFEASDWNALKDIIFQHCLPHMQFKASCDGEPKTWTVQSTKPSVVDFDHFISIKMGRYFFKPANISQAHRYITDHKNDVFAVSVFKWGNHVSTSADLTSFQDQCIRPNVQDRSGAAAESAHSEMVRKLKEKWGSIYSLYESNWRMWASTILKTPTYQHDLHVSNPPPAVLLHLFDSIPNGAQERNQNLQQSMTVALDVIDSCMEGFKTLKRFANDMVTRIELDEESLRTKRRVIEGFLQEITPVALRTDLIDLIRTIPNIEDEEHEESNEE